MSRFNLQSLAFNLRAEEARVARVCQRDANDQGVPIIQLSELSVARGSPRCLAVACGMKHQHKPALRVPKFVGLVLLGA